VKDGKEKVKRKYTGGENGGVQTQNNYSERNKKEK
jgi:hypothetical protein